MKDSHESGAHDAACAACQAIAYMADAYLAHLEGCSPAAAVLAPLFNAMKATLESLADHTNAVIRDLLAEEGKTNDTPVH